MPTYITTESLAANDVLATTYLNRILYDMELFSRHDHSPSAGEGANVVTSSSAATIYLSRLYFRPSLINMFYQSSGTRNVSSASELIGGMMFGFNITDTNASGDYVRIRLALFKGFYGMQMPYIAGPSGGAVSIIINSCTLDTLETYASATASGMYSLSNIDVTATGCYVMQIQLGSKHASSETCIVKLGVVTVFRQRV